MAERLEIAEEIERLAVHCRPPLMSVEDKARWLSDWCADLAGQDIEAIRVACQRWRQGTERKFPMLGQLMPLIRQATVGQPAGAKNDEWRDLSDEEYEALCLTDKIRHRRILASRARGKAGPQWGSTGPILAEEMPDSWHTWRRLAREHDAEAQRLSQYLKTSPKLAAE